ncbi:MAG: hypothetical protein ING99_19390 [Rhodocyclaceae bacterium]|jgi:hypothetical protein|nr:hypothetical protein [Rhodocyclaceae bacterium]
MPHFTIAARDALRTALTGLATTGSRVYTAHTRDDALLFSGQLPGLVLLTPREEIAASAYSSPIYERTAIFEVVVCVEKTSSAADLGLAAYQIVQEVEVALAGPLTVAGRPVSFYLSGSIETESSEQGDRLVAMLILPVQAQFYTTAGVPDAHA